jgi:dTMP kinase
MFIVIDWIDGAGKSTQIKKIKENLENKWKTVKVISYPRYNEQSSFMVQKYLNWDYWRKVWAKQASIFYAIDRFDSSFELKNDLNEYDYVITDRYVSGNMIHQAWKIDNIAERDWFLEWLEDLEFNIFNIPRPDKVIFLNISANQSMINTSSRWWEDKEYITWDKKQDIHEDDKNHLINACNSANHVAEKYNWIKINCEEEWKMKSIDEINSEIMKEII